MATLTNAGLWLLASVLWAVLLTMAVVGLVGLFRWARGYLVGEPTETTGEADAGFGQDRILGSLWLPDEQFEALTAAEREGLTWVAEFDTHVWMGWTGSGYTADWSRHGGAVLTLEGRASRRLAERLRDAAFRREQAGAVERWTWRAPFSRDLYLVETDDAG